VEGLVIAGSILLALAADALWAVRQDLAEEQEVLTSLKIEITENIDSLETTTRIVTEARERIFELHSSSPEQLDSLGAVETLEMLWAIFGASSFHPSDGVRQAVIASGGLSLLKSRELRSALGGLPGLYADAAEEGVRSFALRDVIAQSLPPGTVTAMQLSPDRARDANFSGALAQIRRDASLLDKIAWRSAIQRRYLRELETTRQDYIRILDLIALSRN
jgi:hypothetical protein